MVTRKKGTPLDLNEDYIDQDTNFDDTISEVFFKILSILYTLFRERNTAILAIGSLHLNRKWYIWDPLKDSMLARAKVDSENSEVNIGLGLTEFLNAWVKKQYEVECKLMKGLTDEQKAFLEDRTINKKKYGCVLPPSSAVMPEIFGF